MRGLTVAVIVIFCLASGSYANDRYIEISRNKGWIVAYDKEDEACVAVPQSNRGFFLIRDSQTSMRLIFPAANATWLQDDKAYDVEILTDGGRWNGNMMGLRNNGLSGLMIENPNDRFLDALKSSNRVVIQTQGRRLGPYSLSGSSQTITAVSNCIDIKAAGGFKPAEPSPLPFREAYEWTSADYGTTFSGEGWTASLNGQKNLDETHSVYLKVQFRGGAAETVRLESTENGSGRLAVVPFDNSEPAVFFTSFTGGAHCCTAAYAAIAWGKVVNAIDLGSYDGEGPRLKDVDNDGNFELVSVDQRFLYAFGSYVDSFPPTQIFRVKRNEKIDATRDAAFQPLLRTEFVRLLNQMQNSSSDPTPGMAAGIAASGSLVGLYQAAKWQVPDAVRNALDDAYRSCEPPMCASPEIYKSLDDAISKKLMAWGYDVATYMDDKSKELFTRLSEHSYGPPGEEVEGSCGMQPTQFSVKDNKPSFSAYEMGCSIGSAVDLGGTTIAQGICSGEGEVWLQSYLISHKDDGIRMQQWDGDISQLLSGRMFTSELPRCSKGDEATKQ